MNGVYSTSKLTSLKIDFVKEYDELILVTIPKTASTAKQSFTITGTFFKVVEKYIALRPKNLTENRFFLQYRKGKCTEQPIGKNMFSGMARRIAKYLKLPKAERYSGR